MSATIPDLIKNLADPAVEVRAQAAKALGERGSEAKDAVPALIRALNDRFAAVRDSAIAALSRINLESTVSALIQNLDDPDERVCNSAAKGLAVMIERFALPPTVNQQVFDALAKAAHHSSWFVRSTVMANLGEVAPPEPVLPILIAGLEDEEAEVRQDAAIALQCLGSAAAPAVPHLVTNFWHGIELYATSALGSIGSAATAAIPRLIEALQSPDEDLRGRAAEALGDIGSAEAVPLLLALLQHADADLRQSAAEALQCLGPVAEAAVPNLQKALNDEVATVRATAAKALGEIASGNSAIAEPIVPLLQDADAGVRASAAVALQSVGPEAKIAVPALMAALGDEVERVQQSAAKALEEIGTPEARAAIAHYKQGA